MVFSVKLSGRKRYSRRRSAGVGTGARSPIGEPPVGESRSCVSHLGAASPVRAPDAGLVSEWRAGAVEAAARPVLHELTVTN